MNVGDFRSEDFEQTLNFDGRSSLRRTDKLKLVISNPDGYYGYVAEEGQRILVFIIMKDLRDGVFPVYGAD